MEHSSIPATEPQGARPSISIGEVIVGSLIVGLGVCAWTSLLLAHVGAHDGWGALAAAAAAVLLLIGTSLRIGSPPVVVDRRELAALGGVALLAAVLSFPGFPYAVADKDPGVYVAHAFLIARTGSYSVLDPVQDRDLPRAAISPGARYPGIWLRDRDHSLIVPQFYHLWPATLATFADVFGRRGVVNLGPAVAVLSAIALFLAVKRARDPLAGVLSAILLSTNMLQVWFAKYPTTEVFTQSLVVGAILAAVVAVETEWTLAAGVSGFLTALVFVCRPDGLLLLLLAIALGALAIASGRWNRQWTAFFAGAAPTAGHAFVQAYWLAERYTFVNGMPRFEVVLGTCLLAVVAGFGCRALADATFGSAERFEERVRPWLFRSLVAVAAGVVILSFFRSSLFGEAYTEWQGRTMRSYSELTVHRLSWFFTAPGLVAAFIGSVLVSRRSPKSSVAIVLLPGLALLALYTWNQHIASRMMWWGRRFVPIVVPTVVVLASIALADGLRWSGRGRRTIRALAALVSAFLIASSLSQSWPLRRHREYLGSYEIIDEIDRVAAGKQAVFLWVRGKGVFDPARNFGAPLWFMKGHVSALLPDPPLPEHIDRYRRKFAGQEIFLVSPEQLPASLSSLHATVVARISTSLPMWEESNDARPDGPRSPIRIDSTVRKVELGLVTAQEP